MRDIWDFERYKGHICVPALVVSNSPFGCAWPWARRLLHSATTSEPSLTFITTEILKAVSVRSPTPFGNRKQTYIGSSAESKLRATNVQGAGNRASLWILAAFSFGIAVTEANVRSTLIRRITAYAGLWQGLARWPYTKTKTVQTDSHCCSMRH